MRYISLWIAYLKVNMKRLLEYRADFVFNLISVFIWTATGLFNVLIMFTKITSFYGWGKYEVCLLYGMWSLTFSIYNAFGSGILNIENDIINGKLDISLIKPIDPLFIIVTSRINTMGIGFLIFGLCCIIYSLIKLNLFLIPLIIYFLISAITGGGLIFATYLILACFSFWIKRSSNAIRVGYDIHKFAQYPLDIYGKGIKILLSTLFPYVFTNYYPTAFMLGKTSVFVGMISPIVCLLAFFLSIVFWKISLARYESTGS